MTRERLKDTRGSVTKTFRIRGSEGHWYCTVGLFDNGKPGEIFIWAGKAGDAERAMAHQMALGISVSLQNGQPMRDIAKKMIGVKTEPAGLTDDPEFPLVTGYIDYLGRWLHARWGKPDAEEAT